MNIELKPELKQHFFKCAKSLVWYVTVVCPLADSYVASAARQAGSVAELAASKRTKT